VEEGGSLTIPLQQSIRSEFSGANISLKTFGSGGFSSNAAFDSSLTKEASEAVLDLTKLKVQPGEHTVAFYGSAVAKYRYNPQAVEVAQAALDLAKQELEKATEQAATLTESAATASADEQAALKQRAAEAAQQKAQAEAAVKAAEKSLQQATKAAAPKDIVDIVVSEPFTVRVTPKTEAAQ
jgi:multidrug efflux pump subunit AcrA (membrane-fusion protein)